MAKQKGERITKRKPAERADKPDLHPTEPTRRELEPEKVSKAKAEKARSAAEKHAAEQEAGKPAVGKGRKRARAG